MPQGSIIVHIGMEKTGSTSVQRFLARNADLLLVGGTRVSRLGGTTNHTLLAASVVRAAKTQDIHSWFAVTPGNQAVVRAVAQRLLVSELERARRLVVSSEHLSSRAVDDDEIRALADMLEPIAAEVRVCLYLRRQEELIPSTFSTTIRAGGVEPFSVESALPEIDRYDFAVLTGRWRAVFGSRLEVHVFREEWKAQPVDLLKHFCSSVGIAWDPALAVPDGTSNVSLSGPALAMGRALNQLVAAGRVSRTVRRSFMERCEVPGVGPPFTLTDEQRQAVWSHYAASNEAAAAWLSPDDAAYLLAPPAPSPPLHEPTDAESSELLGRLIESLASPLRSS